MSHFICIPIQIIIRIIFFGTVLTDAVAELGFRMLVDINPDLIPVSFVVPDFL